MWFRFALTIVSLLLFAINDNSYSRYVDTHSMVSMEHNNIMTANATTTWANDTGADLFEIPSDFTVDYEYGDYDKFSNTLTSDDLEQTKIWFNGSYDKIFPLTIPYGDSTTDIFCCIFCDDKGNEWLMALDVELLSGIERYSSLCNHPICVRGSYGGIQEEIQLPRIYLDAIFDRTDGNTVVSRFFRLTGLNNIKSETSSEKTIEASTTELSTCQLFIEVDFVENWIFSRYNVELYLDDQYIETLPHGKYYTKLLDVSTGTHVLMFKEESGSNHCSTEFEVSADSTFTCKIETTSDKINLSNKQVTESIIGATIKMPNTVGMLYSEALQSLKKTGFVNIEYKTVGNHFIWDDDNWLVQGQNLVAGTEVFKSEEVLLECISLNDYFKNTYVGKSVNEIQHSAKDSGFNMIFQDDSGSNLDDIIVTMDEKAKEDWIATNARQYSAKERTAEVTIKYTGEPTPSPIPDSSPASTTSSLLDELLEQGWVYSGIETKQPNSTSPSSNNDDAVATPKTTKKSASAINHSSNDRDVAKKGSSGVYAYRSKGGSYYIYYIINFDEGYVYRFIDGNGEQSCDKVKIDSGDLNNGLQITYHDGDQNWSNWLHFKWKNQPDNLILLDDDFFEYTFYETSLSDALKIKNSKTIVNY